MMKKLLIALGVVAGALLILFLIFRNPDTDAAEMRAKYTSEASRFITAEPGLDIHVRDEGPRGAPVLLLAHGASASLHTWEPWVEELSDDYRIVSYDQPGHGLTGPHPRRCYSDVCMVAAAHAVAEALDLNEFVIGGNSMGGWLAWNYALRHPDRVAGMVLVDAAGITVEEDDEDGLPIGFRILAMPGVNQLATQITPRSMIETSLRQTVVDQDRVSEAEIDRYWELLRYPGNRQATLDRFSAPRGEEATAERMATLTMPTLIQWGTEDTLIPVAVGEAFDERLPNSELIIYENVGHIPQEEMAERSAADVRAFLQRVYAPPEPYLPPPIPEAEPAE
ncbi:MAG: alpha/beta hydrolase [Pacificimonas sp.]|jgi:pimeloyl-ACP methyl ester carboxylesterase|nr:alpha/beta hydrolase [Pacificimonas sp.]